MQLLFLISHCSGSKDPRSTMSRVPEYTSRNILAGHIFGQTPQDLKINEETITTYKIFLAGFQASSE